MTGPNGYDNDGNPITYSISNGEQPKPDTSKNQPNLDTSPREFWLYVEENAIGGSWSFEKIDDSSIHVIEYSAYLAAIRERDELRESEAVKCVHIEEIELQNFRLYDRLKAERDELERVHVEVRKRDAETLASLKAEFAALRDKYSKEDGTGVVQKLESAKAEIERIKEQNSREKYLK